LDPVAVPSFGLCRMTRTSKSSRRSPRLYYLSQQVFPRFEGIEKLSQSGLYIGLLSLSVRSSPFFSCGNVWQVRYLLFSLIPLFRFPPHGCMHVVYPLPRGDSLATPFCQLVVPFPFCKASSSCMIHTRKELGSAGLPVLYLLAKSRLTLVACLSHPQDSILKVVPAALLSASARPPPSRCLFFATNTRRLFCCVLSLPSFFRRLLSSFFFPFPYRFLHFPQLLCQTRVETTALTGDSSFSSPSHPCFSRLPAFLSAGANVLTPVVAADFWLFFPCFVF